MENLNNSLNICVVIVTYNRIDKLKKSLKLYSNQEYLPSCIIVVNNNSTDGTKEYLDLWKVEEGTFKKIVINLSNNLGGSGGFFVGERKALEFNSYDWLMVADDDAYPEKNYISGLVDFILHHDSKQYSVVCGKVLQKNTYQHRTLIKNRWTLNFLRAVPDAFYKRESFHIDAAGYLGLLINIEKLREVGCVNPDYFIWADDVEHCFRLNRVGDLICIPKYTIIHDTENEKGVLNWKYYYGYRNSTNIVKRYFPYHYPFVIFFEVIKIILAPLRGKSFVEMKLRLKAILDGHRNKLGVNRLYKPGWKP